MDVGFIGLGAMGSAMAANLVKAGHQVRAWNRSGDPGIAGVAMAAKPADAFQADAVLTMLSDDPAIREVLLDAGVLHTARPLLDVLGRKVWDLGEAPARANAAKIAANMMITMAIEAMAEAVVLTEANGLPRDAFFELILGTLFGSRSYQTYGANIAGGHYEPGFKARLGLKDLGLAAAAADAAGRRLPMLDAVRGRMAEAVDAGMGEKDWSAMADYTIRHAK